jgi:hypothetical protein
MPTYPIVGYFGARLHEPGKPDFNHLPGHNISYFDDHVDVDIHIHGTVVITLEEHDITLDEYDIALDEHNDEHDITGHHNLILDSYRIIPTWLRRSRPWSNVRVSIAQSTRLLNDHHGFWFSSQFGPQIVLDAVPGAPVFVTRRVMESPMKIRSSAHFFSSTANSGSTYSTDYMLQSRLTIHQQYELWYLCTHVNKGGPSLR